MVIWKGRSIRLPRVYNRCFDQFHSSLYYEVRNTNFTIFFSNSSMLKARGFKSDSYSEVQAKKTKSEYSHARLVKQNVHAVSPGIECGGSGFWR